LTINSYFYDSVAGDRPYSGADFAKAFNVILKNGIIPKDDTGALGLDIGGTNYTTIYAGKATVEGHFVEVTDTELLTVPTGSYAGQIVLRVDSTDARNATLVVKTDRTPIQTTAVYELPLYNVTVTTNIITAVTDVRIQGGAVARMPDNLPYYEWDSAHGYTLFIGNYELCMWIDQPPAKAGRIWIQTDPLG
jgi:hypothetical protein